MNQALLKRRAVELDAVLSRYEASMPDAARLRAAIGDLIIKAESGRLLEPIKTKPLPGELLFSEGSLGTVIDLANAFGHFEVEVAGGPPPALQEIRRRSGRDPLTGDRVAVGA